MPSESEFYIGYLPAAPPGIARFRRRVVIGLLLAAGALACTVAVTQHEFSLGTFDFFTTKQYEGMLSERPYPTLVTGGETRLLTAVGKFGAQRETVGLDGREVELEGKSIQLGDHRMVEVAAGGVKPLAVGVTAGPRDSVDLGEASLEGEIVDSKCYLGVMNPGRGKVHKGCAVRCISGGVPPAFLVKDEADVPVVLMLTDSAGGPANEESLALVGRTIRLRGRLIKTNGLTYFRADLSKAEKL